ncbi:DUF1272 domain-containing protein [Ketobacter nezhaii]|nr:DUF1272 domain-containing protein [Ketobacter sp. MCCC 1A13808]
MRPGCECCDKNLPADCAGAFICSFECTFCESCSRSVLKFVCPNCGGDLVSRSVRPSGITRRIEPYKSMHPGHKLCGATTIENTER